MDTKAHVALFLIAAAGLLPTVFAQTEAPAAMEITLSGGAIHGGTWDGAWSPGPAGSVGLSAAYGPGVFRLALRGYSNDSVDPSRPSFIAIHANAGWGPAIELPAGVRLAATAHLGGVAFVFDDDEIDEPLRNESELAAGFAARADVPIWRSMRAWVGADATRIFTSSREDLIFVDGGLSIALVPPAWLVRAVR